MVFQIHSQQKFFNSVVFVFAPDCDLDKLFKFILGFFSFFLTFFVWKAFQNTRKLSFWVSLFFLPHFIENTFHLSRQSISTCLFLIGTIYVDIFCIISVSPPRYVRSSRNLYIVLVYRSIKLLLAALVSSIILYSFEILGYLVKRFESTIDKDLGEIVSGAPWLLCFWLALSLCLATGWNETSFGQNTRTLLVLLPSLFYCRSANLMWLMGFELVSFRYASLYWMAPLALAFLPLERVGHDGLSIKYFLAKLSQLIWFQARMCTEFSIR